MTDREKAIRILEGHYKNFVLRHNGELLTVNELIALLKAQEPVNPKEVNMYPLGQYACGSCGHISVGSKNYHAKYCPECGKAVKWDG